jgi:hypothetical protein
MINCVTFKGKQLINDILMPTGIRMSKIYSLAMQVKTVNISSYKDRRQFKMSLQTGSLVGACNGAWCTVGFLYLMIHKVIFSIWDKSHAWTLKRSNIIIKSLRKWVLWSRMALLGSDSECELRHLLEMHTIYTDYV